jgi:branched-subunit amino acid transport protein
MGVETARFARDWNFAFLLVALVAALLVADGRAVLGAITGGLCVVAIVARWYAMRKQGRRFYGQQKQVR